MKNKKLWFGLLVLAGGSFGVWRWTRPKEAPIFRTVEAARGDLNMTVLATGVAQPQNRVEIKPPIAGRAEEILAREGDAVKKGKILAWMSSVERAALLDAARAKGVDELAHWEDLYKPTPLVAPLDGIVIARSVEPGQTVTAQDAVLVMSNRLIIKAQVDETDIGQIKAGQKAEITLDAYPNEKIAARVDHVAYEAKTVSNVTIYEVDVLPERVPDFMRSGMTANAVFFTASKIGVLLLPADAVNRENGKKTVMTPNPNGKKRPVPREVETGASDGKQVEIVSGLQEGDKVLVRSFRLPRGNSNNGSNPFSPFGGQRRGSASAGGSNRGSSGHP